MNPEKFNQDRVSYGLQFKKGHPELKGKNFDAALVVEQDYYTLKESDRTNALKGFQKLGRMTIKQPQNRDEFYRDANENRVNVSDYSSKPKTVRLGGY